MTFPLEQWFAIAKPIPIADADMTEAQMMLHALKDDIDPDYGHAKRQYREMREAVITESSQATQRKV